MSELSREPVLDQIFFKARTHHAWLDKAVTDDTLAQVYEMMKWGPTSANCCPLRILFVKSSDAKTKLLEAVAPGNLEKTRTAPVTAILAYDLEFYEKLPKLFPHADARSWFAGNQSLIDSTALKNSTLQCAYFMIAARALGLDCGPMAGFDALKVDAAFFAGTPLRTNLLCNLGYGDASRLFPRSPRLAFSEACKIL